MENIRFVNAPLKIKFEKILQDESVYKKEYDKLSNSEEDSVGQWLKLAKARGETSDSDQVLLKLIVELHRKIDDLTAHVKDEKPTYLNLEKEAHIDAVGFEHFRLEKDKLELDAKYYGRILMPFFPKREVPLFFKAISKNIAQVMLIHDQDEKEWSSFMSARERAMIREAKALKDNEDGVIP
ncbi:MAG: hypothetical protein L3J44_02965 [Campylobacteraceae bacterium]|nr:hypothetical protein [Campylobacteraceae bacterium]